MAQPKTKKPKEVSREVERLFLRGLTPDDIVARAKSEKWGVPQSALSKAIDDATQRVIDIGAALNLDTELGKALGRLEELYLDAKDKGETKVALDVLKERSKMLRIGDHARQVPATIPRPEEKLLNQPAKSNVVRLVK